MAIGGVRVTCPRCPHTAHEDVCAVLVPASPDYRLCGCLAAPHGVLRTTPRSRDELRRLGIDASELAERIPEGCVLVLNSDVRGWRASIFRDMTMLGQERGADLGHLAEYVLTAA